LAVILYLETNFPMSVAMGRDPVAETLLEELIPSFRLTIPSVCYMEALSAIRYESWIRESFRAELERQIIQLERNRTSPQARSLLTHLNPCLKAQDALLSDMKARFDQTLDRLSRKTEFIELSVQIISTTLSADYLDDPTDNLIVCSIVDHARAHSAEEKAFLSGNSKDFRRRDGSKGVPRRGNC
jgi:hypothetical protein